MTHQKLYQFALKKAKYSKHNRQQMAAVVYKSGRILSHATNGKRTGRHAEIRALAHDTDFSSAIIAVARVGGGISKPCRVCYGLIRSLGLRKMVFVDSFGHLTSLDVTSCSEEDFKDVYKE